MTIRIEIAILLGTILSLVSYLHRTSRPYVRVMGFDTTTPERPFVVRADVPAPLPECPQLKTIRMEGEVYFGAVPHVADHLRDLRAAPEHALHLLVMAKSMNFIDLPAAELWRSELQARRAEGGDLYFHRPRPPVLEMWERIGYTTELGCDPTSSRPSGSRSRRSSNAWTGASARTATCASSRNVNGCRHPSPRRNGRRQRRSRRCQRPDPRAAGQALLLCAPETRFKETPHE